MSEVRLIDANALKKNMEFICMGIMAGTEPYNAPLTEIDNAPTVEPFEPDYVGAERLKARQRGYEEGYHNGMKIGKTLNPKIKQGEWGKWIIVEIQCPNCFEYFETDCYSTEELNKCPNCGAENGLIRIRQN